MSLTNGHGFGFPKRQLIRGLLVPADYRQTGVFRHGRFREPAFGR
jgi:hypothetical protein